MTYSFKTSAWPERLWRSNNRDDMARGNVPGSYPISMFGECVTTGAGESLVWSEGMPDDLNVPNGIQLSISSTSASDTGEIVVQYLDGDLLARSEVVTLNGTTPVTTQATDIRAVNGAYTRFGKAVGTITLGIYGRINAGHSTFRTSVYRVPADKRLMMTGIYAGSASGSSASRVTVKLVTSFVNGDSFAEQGYLHPVAGVALQDGSSTFPNFGPFPIRGGEWVGFRAKWDKGADITAGFFGWLENA